MNASTAFFRDQKAASFTNLDVIIFYEFLFFGKHVQISEYSKFNPDKAQFGSLETPFIPQDLKGTIFTCGSRLINSITENKCLPYK